MIISIQNSSFKCKIHRVFSHQPPASHDPSPICSHTCSCCNQRNRERERSIKRRHVYTNQTDICWHTWSPRVAWVHVITRNALRSLSNIQVKWWRGGALLLSPPAPRARRSHRPPATKTILYDFWYITYNNIVITLWPQATSLANRRQSYISCHQHLCVWGLCVLVTRRSSMHCRASRAWKSYESMLPRIEHNNRTVFTRKSSVFRSNSPLSLHFNRKFRKKVVICIAITDRYSQSLLDVSAVWHCGTCNAQPRDQITSRGTRWVNGRREAHCRRVACARR